MVSAVWEERPGGFALPLRGGATPHSAAAATRLDVTRRRPGTARGGVWRVLLLALSPTLWVSVSVVPLWLGPREFVLVSFGYLLKPSSAAVAAGPAGRRRRLRPARIHLDYAIGDRLICGFRAAAKCHRRHGGHERRRSAASAAAAPSPATPDVGCRDVAAATWHSCVVWGGRGPGPLTGLRPVNHRLRAPMDSGRPTPPPRAPQTGGDEAARVARRKARRAVGSLLSCECVVRLRGVPLSRPVSG